MSQVFKVTNSLTLADMTNNNTIAAHQVAVQASRVCLGTQVLPLGCPSGRLRGEEQGGGTPVTQVVAMGSIP